MKTYSLIAPPSADDATLAGRGELGALVHAFDRASTPFGPIDDCPQSLSTAVHIVLTSAFAMWMVWGPERTILYNDAYARPTGAVCNFLSSRRAD